MAWYNFSPGIGLFDGKGGGLFVLASKTAAATVTSLLNMRQVWSIMCSYCLHVSSSTWCLATPIEARPLVCSATAPVGNWLQVRLEICGVHRVAIHPPLPSSGSG